MNPTLLGCALVAMAFTGSAMAARSPEAAQADNALAFDLLREISQEEDGNVLFSPFSIWTALAMTSAGAEGQTLKEMRAVLRLPIDDAAAHAQAGGWAREMMEVKGVELSVANRLWGAKEMVLIDDFLKLTETHYKAGLERVDFEGKTEEARVRINDWVANETRDRIKDLLQPGDVGRDTRLVLTNAIYFKGKWLRPFDKSATRDHEFTLVSGDKIQALAMSQQMGARYLENERLQAVRLPYVEQQTSMIIVLPRKADALKTEAFLDAEGFTQILQGLKPEAQVKVQLPRFESSGRMDLVEVLEEVGMKRAFTNAEFGRMTRERVFISKVIHQAWVKVEEEGTEAAAATAVIVTRSAASPPAEVKSFIVDRPFLFFIVDDRNGGILFAGKVMDPSKQG